MSDRQTAPNQKRLARPTGFTLIETIVALAILSFGILALAAVMSDGIAYMGMSQADYIAQQKAEEGVESVFYARDSQLYTWSQIQNTSQGGIFVDGPEVLCDPGPDGIVDTADDNQTNVDVIYAPGPSGTLNGADAIKMPLSTYTRTIAITNVAGESNLRQITVTIKYTAGRFHRQYVLTSLISRFS